MHREAPRGSGEASCNIEAESVHQSNEKMLLIERENPITRLNRSNRGASELRVAGGCVVAGSGMRAPHYSTAEHGIALVYWQRHGSDSRL